jgi:Ca-activated chloride channel family protein
VSFATPVLFWLGVVAPFLVVAVHLWDRRRQRTLMERLGELASVQRMAAARSPHRRAIKAVIAGVGLGAVLMAAAGPRVRGTSVTRRKGMDLVIALDVSKSMLVGDVEVGEPPQGWPADLKPEDPRPVPKDARWVQGTRLERARQVIDALVEQLPDDRIAIVLFAGASIHFPFTDDENLAVELAHMVGSADLMGGSDIGEALHMGKCLLRAELDDPSVRCAGVNRRGDGGGSRGPGKRPRVTEEAKEERGKAILVLSDGGESNPSVLQEVDQAHQLGISLFFVGVGSEKGGTVPDVCWDGMVAGPKLDGLGGGVVSGLDGDGWRALAVASAAASHYIEVGAEGPFDVAPLVAALNGVQRGDLEQTEQDRPRDIYHLFLFPGLMLLVIEAAIGMRRRVKHPEAVS